MTEKDEGWYSCIAQNALGETFSSAYLRVVECKYLKLFIKLKLHNKTIIKVVYETITKDKIVMKIIETIGSRMFMHLSKAKIFS